MRESASGHRRRWYIGSVGRAFRAPEVEVAVRRQPVRRSRPERAVEATARAAQTPAQASETESPAKKSQQTVAVRARMLRDGELPWCEAEGEVAIVHLPVHISSLKALKRWGKAFEGGYAVVASQTLVLGRRLITQHLSEGKLSVAELGLKPQPPLPVALGGPFPWRSLPVEMRRQMVAELRERPFPWVGVHKELAAKYRTKSHQVASLVQAVTLYGFEDPGVMGVEESAP